MDLSRFPRRRYSEGPTPIAFLPRFSAALAQTCPDGRAPRVWIKRDDLLGLTPGGNKTRKLEYLVADALARGADTLVTCGAPQSNHCRLTLAAAVVEGLRCRFVIEERVPGSFSDTANGNHFLFRLYGVEDMTVVPAGSDVAGAMQNMADDLIAAGRRPYVIPGGGSNALGGLGYVACAQELQVQMTDLGVKFAAAIVGSGSSGTHGGMLAGFLGNHIDVPLYGVGVSRDPADQAPLVRKEALAVLDLLEVDLPVPDESVRCIGGYWQPKYSLPNDKMIEAVQLLARTEAILLDPVYTGKIMAGLIGMAREGRWSDADNVLFLHTGGLPSLFAYTEQLLGR
jgi:D-cysteine desulfhydrase